jgi:hypothetical protein
MIKTEMSIVVENLPLPHRDGLLKKVTTPLPPRDGL